MPEEEKPYYETEEVESAIDKAISKHKKKKETVEAEPIAEPYPEPEPMPNAPEPKPRVRSFGTGENIYLYVKTGLTSYTLVDKTFPSRIEAGQYAESNFPNKKYKTLTQTELKAYMEKQAKRQQQIESTKESAKELGRKTKRGGSQIARGFLRASEDQAQKYGMTRRTMEPEIRSGWGVPRRPEPAYREPEPEYDVYEEPAPRPQPRPEPRRAPPPREERPAWTPPKSPFKPMRGRPAPQQPQRRTRINIPPGGGVFNPRGIGRPPPENPKGKIQQPRQRTRFDIPTGFRSVKPHWVGRQPYFREPYEEKQRVKEKTRKVASRTKKKSKRRKKK